MKRRQLMRYTQAGLLATLGMGLTSGLQTYRAQSSNSLTIQWLGHTCFLFTGDGRRLLANPFQTVGCTAKYRSPKVNADLVLISSQLLDEGYIDGVPGNPRLLYEPGVYQFRGLSIQGISIDHDRLGGRRFGTNVAWRWTQNKINVVHLGGAAAPISLEQRILMGRPDVLLLPVGGGPKAYNPQEAKQAVQTLNPKIIIPTHYRTKAADTACDAVSIDEFLSLMSDTPVRRIAGDAITLRQSDLPSQGSEISILSYKF